MVWQGVAFFQQFFDFGDCLGEEEGFGLEGLEDLFNSVSFAGWEEREKEKERGKGRKGRGGVPFERP